MDQSMLISFQSSRDISFLWHFKQFLKHFSCSSLHLPYHHLFCNF